MKDLYLHLNMEGPVADPELIRRAINDCLDPDTAAAASHILLNPARKEFYDHHHRLLTTIGQLRARLALPRSYAWDALGHQDFDKETPGTSGEWTDILDDLDIQTDLNAGAPAHYLHTKKHWSSIDPLQAMIVGGLIAGICVVLITISTLLSATKSLPENGRVVSQFEESADCNIQIETRPGAGHNSIDIISKKEDRSILSVFVRDGQRAIVSVPQGDYELHFSVGKEEDWTGKRFRRQLRDIAPKEIRVTPDRKCILRIP